jgi:hypothetical protein
MLKGNFKKFFLFILIFVETMAFGAYPVLALHIPSASEIAEDLEQRYHLNRGSITNAGESFNTSANKTQAPQVSISFNPSDPRTGERVIATASPTYFNNDSKSLYYTWYIRHPECTEANTLTDANRKCDLDGNKKIDIRDWKIEAARIIAGNGFDWNAALGKDSPNCSGSSPNPPAYCSQDDQYKVANDDNDGYKATSGGDNNKNMNAHCFIRDFTSGIDYEIVKNASNASISCPNRGDGITRTLVCARTYEDSTGDTDTSITSTYTCKKTSDNPTCGTGGATDFSCPSADEVPLCVKATNIGTDTVIKNDGGQSDKCETIDTDSINFPKGATFPFDAPVCRDNTATTDNTDFICNHDDTKHLFPYYSDGNPEDSGDGTFGKKEELFWHTNPESADTAGNGNKDEANIIGLGQSSFSWNYEPGDKLGVAVEGISSIPTKYTDSSMQIMWALPKNKCDLDDKGSHSITQHDNDTFEVSIPTATIDKNGYDDCLDDNCLNNCLKDNLVDPRGDANTLQLSLSYTPDNPQNDSSATNSGDELDVTASVLGAKDNARLHYQWEVYKSYDGINPSSWGDPLLKSELPEVGRTSGMGLSTFKLKLNFPVPVPQYLKIRLVASEGLDANNNNIGSTDIVIPINSVANKIHVYSTLANDDLSLKLLKDKERCSTGIDGVTCPVTKNEIIGLNIDLPETISDGVWTLDGDPIQPISCSNEASCLAKLSDCDCDPKTGDTADTVYFPVLKENGETYSVEFSGMNYDGNKITLTKNFEVVAPAAAIVSADETTCRPILLGSYVDLDGKQWPDYSETSFAAIAGSTIALKPNLNMPFIKDAHWFIDGTEATSLGAAVESDGTLRFTANKPAGQSYSIAYTGLYSQDSNVKKLLNSSFDVQLDAFYEKVIGNSIDVAMYDSFDGSASAQQTIGHKILASIVTDVPAYISFLFKIVMTVALILFTSHILFSLFPKTNEE